MSAVKVRPSLFKRINPTDVVNTEIQSLVSQLIHKGFTPFGPELSALDGVSLNDAVVQNRLCGKFLEPVEGREQEMHLIACHKMIRHDADGFKFEPRKLSPLNRSAVYKAKSTLSEWYKDFKPSYRFRPPSGESALSNMGLTDVLFKLQDTSHWEVSAGALPYATAIVYNNLWLKRVVKDHFRQNEPTGLPARLQKSIWRNEWLSTKPKCSVGFYVFGKMFASLCTLNNVCRVTTIPKNAKSRRVITMVPFWNMVCQLSLMTDMRSTLLCKTGIDIFTRADLHKTLIRHRSAATIDLRNASNSVWQSCVDFLFPSNLNKYFNRLVDKHYEVNLAGETLYGYFEMFSPMGCGLTFDVMTQMLLALGRTFDSSTSVFGDDIILQASNAERMMAVLSSCGLETNVEKTFVTGSLSESCGGFYNHPLKMDIVSYDFKWCENRVEAFATVNKLRAIIIADQISRSLRNVLEEAHQRILNLLSCYAVDEADVTANAGILSGFIIGTSTNRRLLTPVVLEVQRMWQRKVATVNVVSIESDTIGQPESTATYASWMLRGKSYDPPVADKLVYRLSDVTTETPLAGILLVSII